MCLLANYQEESSAAATHAPNLWSCTSDLGPPTSTSGDVLDGKRILQQESTESQVMRDAFHLLSTWQASRRWFHRVLSCHPARLRDMLAAASSSGSKRLELCFQCCRDTTRANFVASKALEVLHRQHASLRQLLPVVRAAAIAATRSNAEMSVSLSLDARKKAIRRANAVVRLCVSANVLCTHAVREMAECRSAVCTFFHAFASGGVATLTCKAAHLMDMCDHLDDRMIIMREERRLFQHRAIDGIVATMLLHERRQLRLLLCARDHAREMRMCALRLDSLQPSLVSVSLPAPRMEPTPDSRLCEGGLLATAAAAVASLTMLLSRADTKQSDLFEELRIGKADTKKDAAVTNLNRPVGCKRPYRETGIERGQVKVSHVCKRTR